MQVIYNEDELIRYLKTSMMVSPTQPLLLDHFLDEAIEVDVDAVCDGKQVLIGGILEHIEEAGVHSGDSACAFPPHSLSLEIQDILREQLKQLALELGVVGLLNAQFAIQNDQVYILEVNPRASRTVPFIAKASGLSLAQIAARCMIGQSLQQQNAHETVPLYFAVKKPVFPFNKFSNADPILGPEMRSTGEVMGIAENFGLAFGKAQLGAGDALPTSGIAFVSVRDADKQRVVALARNLVGLGFSIVSTRGTASVLEENGIACQVVNKVNEGRPHIVDMIKNDEVSFVVNTTEGEKAIQDSYTIRASAIRHKVSYTTTLAGGEAACLALHAGQAYDVNCLQDLHQHCIVAYE